MSNRFSHTRQDATKGFTKSQKKFVPRTHNSAPKEPHAPNPTLAASLRQSLSQQSGVACAGATASSSRVRLAENEDWVSSKDRAGNFVNYLPQDEAVAAGLGAEEGGLEPVESQRVVDLLNRELSRLLKLNPRNFWREVAGDTSLHDFLDSFLQFRNRWYDFPHHGTKGIVAGIIVGEFELSRRVFMVLYRISSNKDPGVRAADGLSSKDHAVLLQEKKLLDLPKLLDICAIYGHENQELTRSLVVNALHAQPWILDNFTAVLSHFLSIAHTMHQRCNSSLEALLSSGVQGEQKSHQLRENFLEVMDFVNDAIVSMDAFVNAYKPAAVFFSCSVDMSYGNEELLSTLARLHDSLLPSLQWGFQTNPPAIDGLQNASGDMPTDIAVSLKMLSMRIAEFGCKLLDICYLSDEVFEGGFALPAATKMFPANVEDPVIRADILVQTFRDINGVSLAVQKNHNRGTFLQNVERNCQIMSRLEKLRNAEWVSMDDEQFQYLYGITTPSKTVKEYQLNAPTPFSSNKLQTDEDAAIIESKISQIKDLFPDYGKGFLSACLEVYNQNPEEVIQRILEGTLHEDLKFLDTSLEKIPPPKSSSLNRNDKGKGKLSELTVVPSTNAASVVGKQQTNSFSFSSSASVGRYVRKSKHDTPDSASLDSRDEMNSAKTASLISQYEYEDEYDDSFDDLGLSVVGSGLEEIEILGDKINSNLSLGMDGESSAPRASNAKWNSRKKPQFFVKDGKNYSYKVSGSVAVADQNEASLVNQAQKELIHGLGRGGNIPLGALKKLTESNEQQDDESDISEMGGRGNPVNHRGRGRGRRGGGRSHYKKDQAFKKHFSGVGGH